MSQVLVVEDYADARAMVEMILEDAGYRVLLASDGVEGVALARQYHPDAILMDIFMPGLDGIEATRQIKADPASAPIPVVGLSAYALAGDRERAIEAGCAEYHTKPVEFPKLMEQIEILLRGR